MDKDPEVLALLGALRQSVDDEMCSYGLRMVGRFCYRLYRFYASEPSEIVFETYNRDALIGMLRLLIGVERDNAGEE